METNDVKVGVAKMKTKTFFSWFFKFLLNFKAHALQLELNKVSISNFVKFRLQSLGSKIEQAFDKMTKFSLKIGPKRTINQCKIPYMRNKHIFLCKNVFLYTINNLSVVLEIIIS